MPVNQSQYYNIKRKIRNIINSYNVVFTLRALLIPTLILLSYCIIASIIFSNILIKSGQNFLNFCAALIWLISIFVFIKTIRTRPNNTEIIKNFEITNSIFETSPLSNFNNLSAKTKNDFWKLHSEQILNFQIPKVKITSFIIGTDIIKSVFLLALFATIIIMPKFSFNYIFLSFLNKEIAQNIEIYAIKPDYLGNENQTITSENINIIPKYSEIFIKIVNENKKSEIKFNAQKIAFENISKNEIQANFLINKSGKLKVKIDNKYAVFKFKIAQDKAPKLNGPIKINSVGNDKIAIKFKVSDDYGLKNAILKITGNVENNGSYSKITEYVPLDIQKIKNNEETNLLVESGQSALGGNRVKAQLILFDFAENSAKSPNIWFNLQKASFNNDLAQAIFELRLSLLRENVEYEAYSIIQNRFFDNNLGQEFIFQNNIAIDFAPKSIKSIYKILKIYIENDEIIGIDALSKLGLINAIAIIENAHSTKEAKQAGYILWDIIKRLGEFEKDPKSRINDVIEKLKNAISQDSNNSEIDVLNQELKQAIKDHIEELRNQSHESGDMEIEDKSTINGQDLSKMIEDLNSEENQKDKTQKLDELNQLLQNLKLENNNGQENSNDGQTLSNLIDELQNNFDKTQNSNNDDLKKQALENRELAKKLKNQNQDNNEIINQAIQDIENAAKALENGDKENAKNSQKSALDALLSEIQKNDTPDDKDPLGREIPKALNKGDTKGDKNQIPIETDTKRTREILLKLRQKLNDGTINDEERQYYENLLKEKNN